MYLKASITLPLITATGVSILQVDFSILKIIKAKKNQTFDPYYFNKFNIFLNLITSMNDVKSN